MINRKADEKYENNISKQERINRFFATADKLSQFNEVAPFSEADIEAEIQAYRRANGRIA